MIYKTGIGYDIHRLVEGRRLCLGGIEIPYLKGLLGHSDGDVVLHAICDALLGAAGEPDIGEHFPDSDPAYQDIASSELLIKVCALLKHKKYNVVHIDVVVVAQQPVLSPFKLHMRKHIAGLMEIGLDAVSIKAKTNEGLGEIGQGEAIAVYAVATIGGVI
jgi:2-C-methyl-D-erythritol 2,4-cyclodiphosphate synthase